MKMKVENIERALSYFGPQICRDKVKSFMTPGYKVMRASIGPIINGKPESVTFCEYDKLEVNEEEFERYFNEMDVQIGFTEHGAMEIIVHANFPKIISESVKSRYLYQGIEIIVLSHKSKVIYEKDLRVVTVVVDADKTNAMNGLEGDMIITYLPDILKQQIIDHNGDEVIIDKVYRSTFNRRRAVEIQERISKLDAVHRIVDS